MLKTIIGGIIALFVIYKILRILMKSVLKPVINSEPSTPMPITPASPIIPVITVLPVAPEIPTEVVNKPPNSFPLYPISTVKKSLHYGLANYDSFNIYGTGHNLTGTINDATWSYNYAKSRGYSSDLHTDLECTAERLLKFLEDAKAFVKEDTILIFSSGHGTLNTMSQGDESGAGLVFADRILYHKELKRAISNLTCKCIILLDHCYSFLSVRSLQKPTNATPKYVYFKDLGIKVEAHNLKKGVLETKEITVNDIPEIKNEFIFFSSSLGNQVSYDLGNYGAFTLSLKTYVESNGNFDYYYRLEEKINKNLISLELPQECSVSFLNCGDDYKSKLFLD